MKKILFTALAVVAFSEVSMANVNVKINVDKTTKKKIAFTTNCTLEKFKAYNAAISAGFDSKFATSASYSVYFTCMSLQVQ